MATDEPADLAEALEGLAAGLRGTGLRLDIGDVGAARRARDELIDQVDDYLLPRLRRLDAPLLVVLGGSTGSGKSTITNTLLGRTVSPAGVLRPTTRSPVVICHPADEAWFAGSDGLAGLPRLTGGPEPGAEAAASGLDDTGPAGGPVLRLVADAGVGPGLAILDAPDIDSIEETNRDLATQLLAAADLWLFTTTAMRYADAVPWDFLHQARDRGTSLAVIINRIPPGAEAEVVPHLETMLAEQGLSGVDVFPIVQTELADGRLPVEAVGGLRHLLDGLTDDAERRSEVIRTTLDGALSSIDPRVDTVVAAAAAQVEAATGLANAVDDTYRRSVDRLTDDIGSGNLLRGEVLDRWQELVGTAELMQAIQSRISLLRDRLGAFLRGRPAATAEVQGEITSTLEQLLIDHGDGAAATVADRWQSLPGGPQVLDGDRTLERSSDHFRSTVGAEVRAWQDDILELVRQRGAGKRATARVLAFGINSIGIALMLVLFSQTAGLSGGELAIGAGTAGVSQALLSALFGEQAVRELAAEARGLLIDRVERLLDGDAERYRQVLTDTTGHRVTSATDHDADPGSSPDNDTDLAAAEPAAIGPGGAADGPGSEPGDEAGSASPPPSADDPVRRLRRAAAAVERIR